jgi:hypothetical protein
MIGKSRGEHLRLRFQPPKCPRMHDPIAVARVFAAVTMEWFRITAPTRLIRVHGPSRECGN